MKTTMCWNIKDIIKINNLYLKNDDSDEIDELGHPYIFLSCKIDTKNNLKHEFLVSMDRNIEGDEVKLTNHYLLIQGTTKNVGSKKNKSYGEFIKVSLKRKDNTLKTYLFAKNIVLLDDNFIKNNLCNSNHLYNQVNDNTYSKIINLVKRNNLNYELVPKSLISFMYITT